MLIFTWCGQNIQEYYLKQQQKYGFITVTWRKPKEAVSSDSRKNKSCYCLDQCSASSHSNWFSPTLFFPSLNLAYLLEREINPSHSTDLGKLKTNIHTYAHIFIYPRLFTYVNIGAMNTWIVQKCIYKRDPTKQQGCDELESKVS